MAPMFWDKASENQIWNSFPNWSLPEMSLVILVGDMGLFCNHVASLSVECQYWSCKWKHLAIFNGSVRVTNLPMPHGDQHISPFKGTPLDEALALADFPIGKTLKQMSSRFACCACQRFAKILRAKVVRLIWRSKYQRGDVSPVLARRNVFLSSWQWRRQATRLWFAMITARRPQSQTSTALNTKSLCQSIKFFHSHVTW